MKKGKDFRVILGRNSCIQQAHRVLFHSTIGEGSAAFRCAVTPQEEARMLSWNVIPGPGVKAVVCIDSITPAKNEGREPW
jgi:hypothetical protein